MSAEPTVAPAEGRPWVSAEAMLGRPARQETLRESNLTLVAAQIFGVAAAPSRVQITQATGLTKATVSRIVDQLLASGVVEEGDPVMVGRAGRPMVPLVPSGSSLFAVGLEVNTASIGVCALDLAGHVLAERVVRGAFTDADPTQVMIQVAALGEEVVDEVGRRAGRFVGAHLSLPGIVDPDSRRLLLASGLGWRDVAVGDLMAQASHLLAEPLRIGTVQTHAALAEASLRQQAGGGRDFWYVAGDNAVGSALVLGGRPMTGPYGYDGNIGHMLVDPRGPRCRCGARGCLDRYVGRGDLLERAGLPAGLSIGELLEIHQRGGNRRLGAALRRAGSALGTVLASGRNLVAMPTIVLGDNLGQLLPVIREPIEAELRTRLLANEFSMPRLEPSRTGPNSAMRGGALSVLQSVLGDLQRWLVA